jgi:sugar phosphate isomerase/epimerase
MKYAISNIAWKPHERLAIYALLKSYEFSGLEIAPSLFLGGSKTPYEENEMVLIMARDEAKANDLELVSMQALLFGAAGLSLFNDENSRQALTDYCKKAIKFASKLNIPNLVFGSPKNRIVPDHMDDETAQNIAISFFRELGEFACRHNTCIAMEANAAEYGGNFITKTQQAVDLVKAVDSTGFLLNLDIGTMCLEKEEPEIIYDILPLINHIHISEAFLSAVYKGEPAVHKNQAEIMKKAGYKKTVSIEMTAISEQDNLAHVKKALDFVNRIYRTGVLQK